MTAKRRRERLAIEIAGIRMATPLIGASGAFGNGAEYADFVDWSCVGAIAMKGITLEARSGNKGRRIAETPAGVLNCVGLQNPGVDVFVNEIIPQSRAYGTPLIANINGNTVEDYERLAERLSDAPIAAIEVNISCPNTRHGCMAFGVDPVSAAKVTEAVKKKARAPVIVKLSPNVTDIAAIARAAEAAGADAVSLINTILGMAIDPRTWKPVLGNITGGLSGPAVKPVAVRMVYQVAQAVKIPVIGLGGISSALDAVEFFLAGARAVQIGTANLVNPQTINEIAAGLEAYLDEHHLTHIHELVGKLKLPGGDG